MALRIASGGHGCSPLSISDAYAEVPNTKAAEAKLDNSDVERIGHLMSLDRLWLAGRRVSAECLPQLARAETGTRLAQAPGEENLRDRDRRSETQNRRPSLPGWFLAISRKSSGATPFRVGLYARVSTHDQQTLPMQLSAMRAYARRRGWKVREQLEKARDGGKEPSFMRLAGSVHGVRDLSTGKGFSRS